MRRLFLTVVLIGCASGPTQTSQVVELRPQPSATTSSGTSSSVAIATQGPFDCPRAAQMKGPYEALVRQGAHTHVIRDGAAVELSRARFTLLICRTQEGGVYLHASKDPATYQAAGQGRPSALFRGEHAMAEYLSNQSEDLVLADDRVSYWYVEGKESRFDNVRRRADGVIELTRTVEFIYEIEKFPVPAAEVPPGTTFYLVFAEPVDEERVTALARAKITLR